MTPHSVRLQTSVPPAVPAAALFPAARRLLTEKSSATAKADSPDAPTVTFTFRATKITATLKNIQGYSHGGINE